MQVFPTQRTEGHDLRYPQHRGWICVVVSQPAPLVTYAICEPGDVGKRGQEVAP